MYNSPLEQFNVFPVLTLWVSGWLDNSFLNIMLPLAFLGLLIIFLKNLFKWDLKLVPENWQSFVEMLYKFIVSLLYEQAGSGALVYFPFVFNLFFFILFCNFMSLVPFGVALTSHIIIIFYLSLSLWFSVFLIGYLKHDINFFKIFIPEAPFLVLFILIPIEIASYIIRAFSLALRLSANILAGHILVYIVSNFIFNMSLIKFWFFPFLVVILFGILLLEFGVAAVQAYVFTVLFCIYLNDSLKDPEAH